MRIAIVGSRSWRWPSLVTAYVASLPADTVIVTGGARGVDTVAAAAGRARGLRVVVIPADWGRYGRAAGMRRNALVVAASDALVAFHAGGSPGTAHAIALARAAGLPVTVHYPPSQGRLDLEV